MDAEKVEALRDAAVKSLVAYGYDHNQAREAVRRALKVGFNGPNPSFNGDVEDALSVEELVKRSLTHV